MVIVGKKFGSKKAASASAQAVWPTPEVFPIIIASHVHGFLLSCLYLFFSPFCSSPPLYPPFSLLLLSLTGSPSLFPPLFFSLPHPLEKNQCLISNCWIAFLASSPHTPALFLVPFPLTFFFFSFPPYFPNTFPIGLLKSISLLKHIKQLTQDLAIVSANISVFCYYFCSAWNLPVFPEGMPRANGVVFGTKGIADSDQDIFGCATGPPKGILV